MRARLAACSLASDRSTLYVYSTLCYNMAFAEQLTKCHLQALLHEKVKSDTWTSSLQKLKYLALPTRDLWVPLFSTLTY